MVTLFSICVDDSVVELLKATAQTKANGQADAFSLEREKITALRTLAQGVLGLLNDARVLDLLARIIDRADAPNIDDTPEDDEGISLDVVLAEATLRLEGNPEALAILATVSSYAPDLGNIRFARATYMSARDHMAVLAENANLSKAHRALLIACENAIDAVVQE